MCAPGTGETTKELTFDAAQDALTNPLGTGAPLAGLILRSDKLGKEWLRRKFEAEGAMWEGRAATAPTLTLRDQYEKNSAFTDAARTCLATDNCDRLNEMQKERRVKSLQEEAAKSGTSSSHSD